MPNAVIVMPTQADERPYIESQVTSPVKLVGVTQFPQYPVLLRSAGVSGEVLMQYVVDTTGRVERGSDRALRTSHELFTLAIHELLPRFRFRPAELQGRKVRQVVQQEFTFSVERQQ